MADDDQKSERAAEVTGAHGHHHHHEPDGETPSGHVDHDPVCGMVVDPASVGWHLTGFFLTLCGAAAAFVPSAIQGLPDRTLLA
ncbi:hypothetical protein GA0004734_00049030 [Rhizobium sp. 9140]|nr:hypothetical protein GA0004734_00049030 [Rhizobium sp. 9140]